MSLNLKTNCCSFVRHWVPQILIFSCTMLQTWKVWETLPSAALYCTWCR